MKQVLIVAPQFPPLNRAAVHRSRYFAAHLKEFGWKVKILTVESRFYKEDLDYELEKLLPQELEVVRTKAMPEGIIHDISIRAFFWHYRAICRMARKEKMDIIYIPVPPYYSMLLGYLIYRKFAIPYAVDYIDPWVHPFPGCDKPMTKSWLAYQASRILEPIALKYVSLITAVAPGYYAAATERYPWLSKCRLLDMPYGAEKEDFTYLDAHPRRTDLFDPADSKVHIVYAGAMLPRAYSTLEALFAALALLKEKYPGLMGNVLFHFIGTGNRPADPDSFTVKPIAYKWGLSEMVRETAQKIPYLDTLNHLKNSTVVLILGSDEPHYTPSKVFQALLSGRPLIAILHRKSTAIDILKNSRCANVVSFDSESPVRQHIQEIADAVYNVVGVKCAGCSMEDDTVNAYSAREMTRKLAEAFDSVVKNAG